MCPRTSLSNGGKRKQSSSKPDAASAKDSTAAGPRLGAGVVEPSWSSATPVGGGSTSSYKMDPESLSSISLPPGTPIFAPSRTSDWLRCPRLLDLAQRWVPRGPWSPAMLIGTAIHAGVAGHYRGLSTSRQSLGTPGSGAQGMPSELARQALVTGWPQDTGQNLELAWGLVEKGLEAALKTDLLQGSEVVGVEVCLDHPRDNHDPVPGVCAIADLVKRYPGGGLGVLDHKSKMSLDARWLPKTLDETETTWQFWHYAWRASLYYGEEVLTTGQHLIICDRAKTYVHEVSTPLPQVRAWLESARAVWGAMARGERWQNFLSCRDYGGCAFYPGCHTYASDESLFEGLFQRREASPRLSEQEELT